MGKVLPFLMFQDGKAEEAMEFYISLVKNSEIRRIVRYGAEGPGDEGTVMQAVFALNGQEFMCIDSNVTHQFTFTPAFSIYVTCDTEDELVHLYESLLEGGQALMPLDNYGFSKKFGWVNDRFGVSWQLDLLH
ncbi:VOC family protein [Sporosarcina sp. Te-1]|uniref:VOC family protein n=1 Tax=Sporosarcina sp. Te-1 TaxID=2818390 RepID=UPI001A9D6627|nr:VOC family protein [Sporosarcina sp. Te-1]QTD40119.1 VOC family protein [Sporosarcina sp. Te-1]